MQKLFFLILLSLNIFGGLKAQEYILQQYFDQGNALPEGWQFKLDSPYTSATNSGSNPPALKFSASGHFLITPAFNGATDLKFWLKGVSTDSLSTFYIEGYKQNKWDTILLICPISRTGKYFQFELAENITQLRFSYQKSNGNVAFDDLQLFRPSRPPQILNCSILRISDYSIDVTIQLDTAGIVAFLVIPDSISPPTIEQMLQFSSYPYIHSTADSGHIIIMNASSYMSLSNLEPAKQYKLCLLATGSKNNINTNSKIFVVPFTTSPPKPTLFFSAIVKGKSNNKLIAIYNPSSDTIDLSQYRIAMATNGGGWLTSYFNFKKPTPLPPYQQFIIMKSTADSSFKANFNPDTLTSNRVINFTGNDARALQRSINQGKTWFTVDVYGLPNQSSNFDVAGISGAAGKYNLFRKRNVKSGNINWLSSAGTDTLNSEWFLTTLTDYSPILMPFNTTKRKISWLSLSFLTAPSNLLVDTFQQVIYVTFPNNINLHNIPWNASLPEHVIMQPAETALFDFSKDFSFFLIDTLLHDTCQWTFKIKTINSASITLCSKDIVIYPNPASDYLYLYTPKNMNILLVEIYSSSGTIIASFKSFPISITNLQPGMYFIKIYLANKEIYRYFFVKTP